MADRVVDDLFSENERLRSQNAELELETKELRRRVRELEADPVPTATTDLEERDTSKVGVRAAIGRAVRHNPAAGEVLPPDQRATWARGRTEHDK